MNKKRGLIITGGNISTDFAKSYIERHNLMAEDTIVLAVDKGLMISNELSIPINYLLGDFDSVPSHLLEKYKELNVERDTFQLLEYNPVKDATDTQIAVDLAIRLGVEEIIILGGTGTRLDHVLANIQILVSPLNENIKAYLVDEHNKIYLLKNNLTLYKNKLHGDYVSLLPLTDVVYGITLEGFKYPLNNKTYYLGDSIGVSNEVVKEEANILLDSGTLIVIESKD